MENLDLWRAAAAVVMAAVVAGTGILGAAGIPAAAAATRTASATSAGIMLRSAIVMIFRGCLQPLDGIIVMVRVLTIVTAPRTVHIRPHLAGWTR